MPQYALETLVALAKQLLANVADDAELKAAASTVSINEAKLAHGQRLLDATVTADTRKTELEADLQDVSARLRQKRSATKKVFNKQFKLAKEGIEDPKLRVLLGIDKNLETTQGAHHAQMAQFYAAALANTAVEKALAGLSITRALLEQGRDAVANITALEHEHARAKGSKEQATKVRKQALDTMAAWYKATMDGMAYATRETPQLMEKLGVTVE